MKRALEEEECHIKRRKALSLKEIRLQHYVSVYLTHYSPSIALTMHLLRQEVYNDVMRSIHYIMFYDQFNSLDLTQTSIIRPTLNCLMTLSKERTLSYIGSISGQLYGNTHRLLKVIHEMANITIDIACGSHHVILLTTRGLFGIGSNNYGQLGISTNINEKRTNHVDKPKSININEDVKNVISIHCSDLSTKVLTVNGLYVFGSNLNGQLGLPYPSIENKFTPCILNLNDDLYGGKQKILSVSCGEGFMILRTCYRLYLCGKITSHRVQPLAQDLPIRGRLISDSIRDITCLLPFDVSNIKSISCGLNHILILTNDGLYGFGFNNDGQLGLRHKAVSDDDDDHVYDKVIHTTFTKISIPYLDDQVSNIKSIHCGFHTSFILTNDGLLYGTGLNGRGQLGLGDLIDRFEFTRIPIENVKTVHLPIEASYSIITTNEDIVYACGSNESGLLGYDEEIICKLLFTKIEHI